MKGTLDTYTSHKGSLLRVIFTLLFYFLSLLTFTVRNLALFILVLELFCLMDTHAAQEIALVLLLVSQLTRLVKSFFGLP